LFVTGLVPRKGRFDCPAASLGEQQSRPKGRNAERRTAVHKGPAGDDTEKKRSMTKRQVSEVAEKPGGIHGVLDEKGWRQTK